MQEIYVLASFSPFTKQNERERRKKEKLLNSIIFLFIYGKLRSVLQQCKSKITDKHFKALIEKEIMDAQK